MLKSLSLRMHLCLQSLAYYHITFFSSMANWTNICLTILCAIICAEVALCSHSLYVYGVRMSVGHIAALHVCCNISHFLALLCTACFSIDCEGPNELSIRSVETMIAMNRFKFNVIKGPAHNTLVYKGVYRVAITREKYFMTSVVSFGMQGTS